ncbi:MAG TPA: immunity 17 family protein [Lacunisphaera sp.]|nr:immunity 17 family protein [Lacunisphaera sp.]
MSREVLLSAILFIGAAVCLGTAILDWNWAMNSAQAKPLVALIGRRNTRIFYALLGVALIVLGVLLLKGVLPLPERR